LQLQYAYVFFCHIASIKKQRAAIERYSLLLEVNRNETLSKTLTSACIDISSAEELQQMVSGWANLQLQEWMP
jgi:hypothetical protein